MKEYPKDVMPLYAQGHSLAEWLIESRGRKAFLEFLADGMRDENWPRAVHQHYGFDSLLTMQSSWNDWVKQGRPQIAMNTGPIGKLASNTTVGAPGNASAGPPIVRMQSPDTVVQAKAVVPTSPVKQASEDVAVTVAQPGSSVYVVSSGPAKSESHALPPPNPALGTGASVYDASRTAGTLRR